MPKDSRRSAEYFLESFFFFEFPNAFDTIMVPPSRHLPASSCLFMVDSRRARWT
ncbi:hypothetical protein RISK_002017 [Rhodopirellula islandica]|uniref:Uncharacterized protein n=1 Tax=Rhodopirellula islandica TaxID=595434 RepID=A0A0J1BHZ1_RHOIS|nr:hypothetical protein RISK_002017 [Rhodopirellula islandica]